MQVAQKLTIEDFEKLPHELAYYHELDDGELIDVSGNMPPHIWLRDYFGAILLLHVRQHRLGSIVLEQEFRFGDNAHGPDISFVTLEKHQQFDPDRRVQPVVPDLAIEVVSKNDTFGDIVRKAHRYIQWGTQEVWVIHIPTREAYFYSPSGDRILRDNEFFSSPLIPGFEIPLRDLFEVASGNL